MKDRRPLTYELQVVRHANSPYRRQLRVEEDVTPVYHQLFPIHEPLKRISQATQRRISVDEIPIYRAPLRRHIVTATSSPEADVNHTIRQSASPGACVGRMGFSSSPDISVPGNEGPNRAGSAGPPPTLAPPAPALPSPTPAPTSASPGFSSLPPTSSSAPTPSPASASGIPLKRKDHKIRGQDTYTRWFLSRNDLPLEIPTAHGHADPGDLFVHHWANGVQVWIRGTETTWGNVDGGHPHPTLPTHRLRMLANGEPRWVTKKSETSSRPRNCYS